MNPGHRWGAPEYLILIGSCLFIFVLWFSAYIEADIRLLHFFQAWMYLATVVLALRCNRWGYFVGISAAAFWDYTNLFVTTFFVSGIHWLSAWIHTGHLKRVDQIIAVPAWTANFLVVAGCVWAYSRLPDKPRGDLARFALTFILTTGFFAAAMAVCQPRYLPLFRQLLHPHRFW